METWDAISARRDVRSYTDQPIAPEDLDRILEAAWRAPSSSNQQRWDFVVCTERRRLQDLAKVWRHRRACRHVRGDDRARRAGRLRRVHPRVDPVRPRAGGHEHHAAAADLGIGSGHSVVEDQELARRILGFPDDRFCALLIPLGYPADRPLRPIHRPNRRPFDEVVHRERW